MNTERVDWFGDAESSRPGQCRWLTPEGGYALDVMPTDEAVLGFTNKWYEMALALAEPFDLGEGTVIRIPPASVFIGTKWGAFADRGAGDYLGSHDLEDLITVVAGRPELPREVREAPETLRRFIASLAGEFLRDDQAIYAIQGALPDAAYLPEIIDQTISRFEDLRAIPIG